MSSSKRLYSRMHAADHSPQRQYSALIVEDDPVCAALYRQCLYDILPGIEIIEAAHGYDALCRLAELKPDLMILDLQMPGFDGVELLSLLTGKAAYGDLPVIVVSSTPDDAAELVEKLPNASVFIKPLRPALLQKVVKESLRLGARLDAETGTGPDGSAAFKAYTGNESRLLYVIAEYFYDLLPERLAQLEHYLARADLRKLREWCHAMTGTASVVGATALLDLLRELRNALDEGDIEQCKALGPRLMEHARQHAIALDRTFHLASSGDNSE